MKNEFLKTLWMLRFQKMKHNEAEAAWTYQEILNECLLDFGPEDAVVAHLQRLVREERAHEKLAGELITICQRNHPEFGAQG